MICYDWSAEHFARHFLWPCGCKGYVLRITNPDGDVHEVREVHRSRAPSGAFTSSVRSVHELRQEHLRIPSGTYWGPIDKYLLHCIRTFFVHLFVNHC